MKKHLIPTLILIAYCAFLINLQVFKSISTFKIGRLMFKFGGTDVNGQANFLPFKTILPYLFGEHGRLIAGVNLIGNIILLAPIGLLLPLLYPKMTWKKSLALAVVTCLAIEIMQVVFHVGVFDIDDIILNALGVMIGYWVFIVLAGWVHKNDIFEVEEIGN